MAAELPRPGVEVIQEIRSTSPTIIRPTLVPFVCGAAKEIVEVTKADGTLNPDAKQGSYTQLPKVISQTSFPSPRSNIDEVDVEEDSIKVFYLFGGKLSQLERDPGESFLVAHNYAMRPGVRSLPFTTGTGLDLDTKLLVLAIDVTARLNTSRDVTVTFAGTGGNLTPQQIIDQINSAVGQDVASIITLGSQSRIAITSTKYGASASVTVRPGGSANTTFDFAASTETRIEGSGFRAQELNNNTTLSPWIEWSKGSYQIDGVAQGSLPVYDDTVGAPSTDFGVGFTDSSETFTASYIQSATLFTGVSSLDLKVGDEFWADGAQPNGAVIMKVEATRFKLGVLDTALSVFDDDGNVVSAVYNASNANTLFSSVPFGPRYGWFMAKNLTGNAAATAATMTGTTLGAVAETGTIEAPNIPAGVGPFALAGLTLEFDITVNGVEQATSTFTFTGGPFADLAAIVAAINAGVTPGYFAHTNLAGTKIAFSTDLTGATQAITLRATSTGLVALGFVAATAYSDTGKDVEFVDIAATLLSGVHTFPLTLGGPAETLIVQTSADADAVSPTYGTTLTHTFSTAGPFADIAALLAELTSGTSWGGAGPTAVGLAVTNESNRIRITSIATGSTVGIRIGAASTSIGVGASDIQYVSLAADQGEEELLAQTLKIRLNDRPRVYEALFTSNSLVDAVALINEVVGWPVASIGGGTSRQLVLTSSLQGYASKVEVVTDAHTSGTQPASRKAAAALGFTITGQSATGTGRPNPDLSLDVSGNVVLGAEALRSIVTGQPFEPGNADIYLQYTGLRKDVSPVAASPGLLRISDVTTLQTVLSPIRSDNPLGLGMFFMLINAPGIQCAGLGVDETSAAEPFGTPAAYTKIANFIESEEIYAIAPMTHSETVAQIFGTHITFMSGPEQKGERILFFNPLVPDRAVDDIAASGLSGNTTATENQFVLDVNPIAELVDRGLDPTDLTVDDNVFLEIVVGSETRKYSVSAVSGVVATLRSTFDTDENLDAFFTVTTLSETLVNVDWKLAVRGAQLLIPGSSLPDKGLIAETVQAKAAAYKSRRMHYIFPEKVRATLGSVEELIEGFYACAAIAGMVARFPPQQGFTNLPMTGFVGVVGSNDTYSVQQLNVMAAGGAYILIQEAEGAPLISRHQLSTDLSKIETRELSITKVVDFTAKFLRTGLRNFIGTFNITTPFLDTLSTVIQGMIGFLVENGVLIGGDLSNLIQSKDSPDTVLVDVVLNVPYPCNYIRLTLVI